MNERLGHAPDPDLQMEGRVRGRNFDYLTTQFKRIFLLADRDTEPDLRRSDTRVLEEIVNDYVPDSIEIKSLEEALKRDRHILIGMANEYPGLRGVRDTASGNEVQINPTTAYEPDDFLMKQSLGERESEFVQRLVTVTLVLDPDKHNPEGVIKSIRGLFKRRGFTKDQTESLLQITRTTIVDREKLEKAIKKGEVELLPGALKIKRVGWSIVPRTIITDQEVEEAEEKARQLQ
ncbi:MAG: hypothetical protein A2W22_04770 [Candidatus Levybacteria bacterium RBG_16_35_11]|nr:MAG: hypothetical protein A2W22_04770 [Candidatus Levybacteria bacterium RBG_16_35_11]